ncbi:GtrA family protein [Cryobacterium roopkundense]|uniref:Putative flippase GtrA n=1 Tax=Cryobacterium roopkundense TaxID=1001240 RepID=A0A7W8ZY35_9MICO|nr:GtrA family protein [Cryobacterium roopkundense]MBB5642178.1 putative flippase GtrA [Cryobacterium roopkundense]
MTTISINRNRLLALASQVGKFGAVGLVGFVVDVAVFTLLRTTVFTPENMHAGPIYAKIISTTLAIAANWVGNRFWTFGEHRQSRALREGLEFLAVSLVGMGIGLACLWVSHYVLGYTSVLADNISSNVIGLALGSVFRFVLYRYWVFSPSRRGAAATVEADLEADAATAMELEAIELHALRLKAKAEARQ